MRRLLPLIPLVLTACATTGADSGLTIETTSKGQVLAGATCVVRSPSGSTTVTTPAKLPPVTGAGDLQVVCDKPGYRTSEFLFRPAGARSGSNIGIGLGGGGGHVGVGVGLNFPLGARNSEYPSHVTVDMNPQ